MGVTDLWSVLGPVKEHLQLSRLHGQRVAVDLSIWICESQSNRQIQGIIMKPFLRNLFFRVCHMLQLGIDLIFVIDGQAPEMKVKTMQKRQNGRFLYGKSLRHDIQHCKNMKRSNLNASVKECCELLDYLGVPYLESQGEAEAYCAFLNKNGVVDACLTNDGDAFLYGAKRVYRNFTMDKKDPHVESYTMQDIKLKLSLDQEKLVAFALLTGCDYQPKGVPYVGMETALKLLMAIPDKDVLSRFRQWRSMKPSDCCCAIEKLVWEKSCKLLDFPAEQIIKEFLISKDVLPKKNLQWKCPNMSKFHNFMLVKLEWPKEYSVQKVLPLLTRWIMLEIVGLVTTKAHGLHLTPVKILKNRVCKGVPSVEVEWTISGSSSNEVYVTVENKEMINQCFPHLFKQFLQELNKNTKTKTASRIKTKKDNSVLDEHLPLKERIKDTYMPTENHKPNKEISKQLPSLTNSIANETETDSETTKPVELCSKSSDRILSFTSLLTYSSDQQTNSKSDRTTSSNRLICNLKRNFCLEIDSSNDEDSDDSLYLPVSHKLFNRYQIDNESENEDSFNSDDKDHFLNLSQAPCDDNSNKPNQSKQLEALNAKKKFSGNLSYMPTDHSGNCQLLSKTDEITEEFSMLNVNDVADSMSSVMVAPHLSIDTEESSLSADAVLRSFSTVPPQLCTDVVEGSFSTVPTQLCTDVVEESFSTVSTQLCTDVVCQSPSTDTTAPLYRDVIKSFSQTDAAHLCPSTLKVTSEFYIPKISKEASLIPEFSNLNRDLKEDSIPYSSFEDHSSIMDAACNLTPDSLNSFCESRIGNFQLISSLLDDSSEFKLNFDSCKTGKVFPEDLNTGLNKLILKSVDLDEKNTKFLSHYKENIRSSSCKNNYNCPNQAPLQQGDFRIFEENSYLSYIHDSFSQQTDTKSVIPKLIIKKNPIKSHWDYVNLSLNPLDNSNNSFNDTFDDYKGSFRMKAEVDFKDNCNVDDAELGLKPNLESPLPLLMRLGKHFSGEYIKNLKK